MYNYKQQNYTHRTKYRFGNSSANQSYTHLYSDITQRHKQTPDFTILFFFWYKINFHI